MDLPSLGEWLLCCVNGCATTQKFLALKPNGAHIEYDRADLEGRDVDYFHARVRPEDPQHRQLSADGLAGTSWRAQQNALIGVVERVKRLHDFQWSQADHIVSSPTESWHTKCLHDPVSCQTSHCPT